MVRHKMYFSGRSKGKKRERRAIGMKMHKQ